MRGLIGKALIAVAACGLSTSVASAAGSVEVLHFWTSGSEAAALNTLKQNLAAEGIGWKDMPVAGGGGGNAMTVLRAQVTAGNPPTAAQMLGYDILDWAQLGVLANLDDVAKAGHWDAVVPSAIQTFAKYQGHWIAAPVDVHSTNWVWANKQLLDSLGIAQPTTWDQFIAAMAKVKAAGKIPLAVGGQDWQEAVMFDSVVLSVGGTVLYKRAFYDLDPKALGSQQMIEAFRRMGELRSFVDPNFSGRDWNLATALVINGQAAFQMMGDWAKGEFLRAGKKPGVDFECFRTPGTAGDVTFNSDMFVMFKVGRAQRAAQDAMAKAVMSPSFQITFNTVKGSVPARTDVPDTAFDPCGRMAMAQLKAADEQGTLLGSMGEGSADRAAVEHAIFDVVTANFNGQYSAEQAAQELVKAVALAQ
jgi:glucose/mannose transport system substrate-binding protein